MQNFLKCMVLCSICLCSCLSLCQLPPATAHLGKPEKDGDFNGIFWNQQWNVRYWDKDFLVAYNKFPSKDSFAAALYDETGRMAAGTSIWMEGAKEAIVNGAAVTRTGNLVLAGAFVTEKNAIAHFIAQADSQGNIVHLIRTNPQAPMMICASGEHVWVYGWDRERNANGLTYPMLNEYTFEKGLVYSTLDSGIPASLKWEDVTLRCTDSQVVLLMGGMHEVMRLDTATKKLTRTKYSGLSDSIQISGIALTDSNDLFISVREKHKNPGTGLFHFETFSNGTGGWSAVPESVGLLRNPEIGFTSVLGSQGSKLVYLKNPRPSAIISWATVTTKP
jgi:hypothetical protein